MRKKLILFLTTILVLSMLVACGDTGSSGSSHSKKKSKDKNEKEETSLLVGSHDDSDDEDDDIDEDEAKAAGKDEDKSDNSKDTAKEDTTKEDTTKEDTTKEDTTKEDTTKDKKASSDYMPGFHDYEYNGKIYKVEDGIDDSEIEIGCLGYDFTATPIVYHSDGTVTRIKTASKDDIEKQVPYIIQSLVEYGRWFYGGADCGRVESDSTMVPSRTKYKITNTYDDGYYMHYQGLFSCYNAYDEAVKYNVRSKTYKYYFHIVVNKYNPTNYDGCCITFYDQP